MLILRQVNDIRQWRERERKNKNKELSLRIERKLVDIFGLGSKMVGESFICPLKFDIHFVLETK